MNKNFYIEKRNDVINKLENNSIMILFAGKDICKSADEAYEFTINRNFYLTSTI